MFDVSQSDAAVYAHIHADRIVAKPKNAVYKKQTADYVSLFARLVAKWRAETSFLSLIEDKVRHKAFKQIVKLGPVAIPLIVDELRIQPDHLYIALHMITKEDPTPLAAKKTSDAVNAWLAWAERNKQYAD